MKYRILPLCLLGLTGCGTLHTPNDSVNAIYNTTSAVIKGEGANCSTGHPDDRRECLQRS